MKIQIEFDNSCEAKITIEGREITYGYRDGMWQFTSGLNIADEEHSTTIAGMIATKLTSPLIDILQAWLPEEPSPDNDNWEPWERLTESAADEVYERMDP